MQGESTLTPENIRNSKTSTALYNELKDKEIETYWFYGTKVEGKLFKWSMSHDIPNFLNIPFNKHGRMDSRYAVPLFSETKLKAIGGNALLAKTNASRETYSQDLGFMLTNKDNPSDTTSIYRTRGYTGPSSQIEYTFGNLNGDNYKLNPIVKFMGVEMLADSSYDAKLEFPVEITNFKVTRSKHKEYRFYYNESHYDYAYYAATTVELKESEDVADWGYVYEDPNGKLVRISLNGNSSPYTDTNHVHYRNSAHDHVCLYEYVRYEGDSEYYYGEKKTYNLDYEEEFFCPDDNHPHLIDLGLPSGTKWACCNVGASSPEGYGGYYAWGETEEKSEYTLGTYVHYDFNIWNYINIGSDISGTKYDVAHVKWGGDWHMPTLAQIQELLDYTNADYTYLNGVAGKIFTGSNGNTIFLPFAGKRVVKGVRYAGYYCEYWSSTLDNDYDSTVKEYVYQLYCYDNGGYKTSDERGNGLSVRPVQ